MRMQNVYSKKFKIKKFYNDKLIGILVHDKFIKKDLYKKINVSIINIASINYKINIEKDYENMNINVGTLIIN